MRHLVKEKGLSSRFIIDSCGTGPWHVGERPHDETRKVAERHGVSLHGQRARRIEAKDFKLFDLVVAMDRSNREDLQRIAGSESARIVCLREFDPEAGDLDVPDPYYGGQNGFEECYEIIVRCCERLLDHCLEKVS